MSKILVLPDAQVGPDRDMSYLNLIGRYIVDKKPDVIVNIGDFADMPSLCSYDFGKRQYEGRRYKKDIEAVKEGMNILLGPMRRSQASQKRRGVKVWQPRMIFTLGNHERRIQKAVDLDPKLEGLISIDDLGYKEAGWEVYDFLETVTVGGVVFSHYLISGIMGRPVTSARALLTKHHQSAVMGHHQQRDIAYATRADGKRMTAIFTGSCSPHDEEYLGPQGNKFWRGIWMLHGVDDGEFDEMPVSLQYLERKYNG